MKKMMKKEEETRMNGMNDRFLDRILHSLLRLLSLKCRLEEGGVRLFEGLDLTVTEKSRRRRERGEKTGKGEGRGGRGKE